MGVVARGRGGGGEVCKEPTFFQILLVGKDEEERVLHFAVVDDAVKLLAGLVYAGAVGGVDDEDETLGA